jgi:hypothetical protein
MMTQHRCHVDSRLVHSCKAWLGARAAGYPGIDRRFRAQHEDHERRIGRRVDIAHAFAPVGTIPFSDQQVADWAARDADSYVIHNWKPAHRWLDATGRDAEVDERIDKAALRIAELAPKKIMLALHHEPENDVDIAGTTDHYRSMWRYVRRRFKSAGADNVVWVLAHMNYPKWDETVFQLYPGDEHVDWIGFNAYGSAHRPKLGDNIGRFVDLLDGHGNQWRSPGDKPMAVVEWSYSKALRNEGRDYFKQATKIMDADQFPQVKAWMVFDSPGAEGNGSLRIGFDRWGRPDARKEAAYRRFAGHSAFTCPDSGGR